MRKKLRKEDWKEVYIPIPLASLKVPIREFCSIHDLDVFSYDEEGLGRLAATVFDVDGTVVWLCGADLSGSNIDCNFDVRSYELDTTLALSRICAEFKLPFKEFSWVSNDLGKAKWALSRYDDNGNEIEMFRFHSQLAVNAVKKRYESKGHKQAYFVSKL